MPALGERSVDICGGHDTPPPNPAAAPNHPLLSLLGGDPDSSIHEVEINESELAEFEQEFSDLDNDDTMMTDSGESPDGQAMPQQNLFSQPHPLRQEDLSDRVEDEGLDYCDMQRQHEQGEGQEEEDRSKWSPLSLTCISGCELYFISYPVTVL